MRPRFGGVSRQRQQREGDAAISGHIQAKLHLLDVLTATLGAAIGWHRNHRDSAGRGARPGIGIERNRHIPVRSKELRRGDVVMDLAHPQFPLLHGCQRGGTLQRAAVLGQPLQDPSQAVVIELLGCHAVVIADARRFRPFADQIHRLGIQQAIQDQDLDQRAQRHVPLCGNDLIDDPGESPLLEDCGNHWESPDHLRTDPRVSVHAPAPWQKG